MQLPSRSLNEAPVQGFRSLAGLGSLLIGTEAVEVQLVRLSGGVSFMEKHTMPDMIQARTHCLWGLSRQHAFPVMEILHP